MKVKSTKRAARRTAAVSEVGDATTKSTRHQKLHNAKREKNDEFYTQYRDVESELMEYVIHDVDTFRDKTILLPCDDPCESNFTKFLAAKFDDFGIKKLISTSYNPGGRGKLFTFDRDTTGDGHIDIDDVRASGLAGDGDFRSDEVCALRDEADVIITNPPFSLIREFIPWLIEANKQFIMIAPKSSVQNTWFFSPIHQGKMWAGTRPWTGGMQFTVPEDAVKFTEIVDGVKMFSVPAVWFTNIDHGRRHTPLGLSPMAQNLKHRTKLMGKEAYDVYDNYDAIVVPEVVMIPKDYAGVMGVPVTFIDKFCPEQFEILGITERSDDAPSAVLRKPGYPRYDAPYINGARKWPCIFIRHTKKSLKRKR